MGLAKLKPIQWLRHKHLIILCMHPTIHMKSRQVYEALQAAGCDITYEHTRKILSCTNDVFYSPRHGMWALTAVGLSTQNTMLMDMTRLAVIHARVRAMQPVPDGTITYRKNEEGHHVCSGCGAYMGTPHLPSCTAPAGDEGLDAAVTVR